MIFSTASSEHNPPNSSEQPATLNNISPRDDLVRKTSSSSPQLPPSATLSSNYDSLISFGLHFRPSQNPRMPSSPKLDATLLPRVSIRRASAHIVRRFFFARRGSRRTLILFIILAVIYFFFIRSDDNLHDMQFDDNDEDIVQHPKRAHKEHAAALQALQKERERKAQTRPPMTRSRDGLIRVGDWEGIHPLLQIIDTAENQWKTEIDFRPSTVCSSQISSES
jgi:hypothetical protein